MKDPFRLHDQIVARRVLHAFLTAAKVRHTDPATELPDEGLEGRKDFDCLVPLLASLLLALTRHALDLGPGEDSSDAETIAAGAAMIGLGRIKRCSCYFFSNKFGKSWINDARRTSSTHRTGLSTGPSKDAAPSVIDRAEARPEVAPGGEQFDERVEALRLLLSLSRRVWTYAALAGVKYPQVGWKGELAECYLTNGRQQRLSRDLQAWVRLEDELEEAILRVVQEASGLEPGEVDNAPDDPVVVALEQLWEAPNARACQFPLVFDTVLDFILGHPGFIMASACPHLAESFRLAAVVLRSVPRDVVLAAAVELGAAIGPVWMRQQCVAFLQRGRSGGSAPAGRFAGGAIEAHVKNLATDHGSYEYDPPQVLANIDALQLPEGGLVLPNKVKSGGESQTSQPLTDRIPLRVRWRMYESRLGPGTPLFNATQLLGLGRAPGEMTARLPSLMPGPSRTDTSLLERARAVVAEWELESTRGDDPNATDGDRRLRHSVHEELPERLLKNPDALAESRRMLDLWVGLPSSAPTSWSDLKPDPRKDEVWLTVLSAVRVVLVEDVHEIVRQVYLAYSGYSSAPDAATFLESILGPDPDTSSTWPSPPEVERRLLERARKNLPSVTAVVALDDHSVVAGGANGKVWVLDVRTGDIVIMGGHRGPVHAVIALPDGSLASGGEDGTVRVWDPVRDPKAQRVKTNNAHEGRVITLSEAGDGRVVSGGADGRIVIWNPHTDESITRPETHSERVRALVGLPDGRTLSGGGDRVVLVARIGERKAGHLVHACGPVSAIAAIDKGRAASAGGDFVVLKWDLGSARGEEFARHEALVTSLSLVDDGSLVSIGADGRVYLGSLGENLGRLVAWLKTPLNAVVVAGGRLYVACEDGRVQALEPRDASLEVVMDCGDRVRCLARLAGDPPRIVAGTWQGKVVVGGPGVAPVSFDAPPFQ